MTLEVTPAQAQKVNVAAELGKLSLTLRPTGAQIPSAVQPDAGVATWAGDVSPALGSVTPPIKVVADPPKVAVMRGEKAVEMVTPR